ncbi:MAG: hypothetical protein KAT00_06835 [Planctomycetes bacterium]|nr:hypothetical protein [Planctomycetota bacterium]
MSIAYDRWLNVLTQADRDTWDALAAVTVFTNGLGLSYNPSGWNLFLRTASLEQMWHFQQNDDAPPAAVATHQAVAYQVDGITDRLQARILPALPVNSFCVFYFTSAFRPTVNFFRGPWPNSYADDGPAFQVWNDLSLTLEYFSGDRVFIRDRYIDPDGGVSSVFYTTFDVP